jgi:hypothetical protein
MAIPLSRVDKLIRKYSHLHYFDRRVLELEWLPIWLIIGQPAEGRLRLIPTKRSSYNEIKKSCKSGFVLILGVFRYVYCASA